LLAESEPKVVLLGAKILARLLVVHGSSYVSKFASKTGGFVIMKHRFKRWWNVAPLWSICFCILFGKDVAKVDVDAPLDLFALLEAFSDGDKAKVVYPEVLPVITAMLKAGVGTVVAGLSEDENKDSGKGKEKESALDVPKSLRMRSLSLNDQATAGSAQGKSKPVITFIYWFIDSNRTCRKQTLGKAHGRVDKDVANDNTVYIASALHIPTVP
jgi:hypothetical protein